MAFQGLNKSKWLSQSLSLVLSDFNASSFPHSVIQSDEGTHQTSLEREPKEEDGLSSYWYA